MRGKVGVALLILFATIFCVSTFALAGAPPPPAPEAAPPPAPEYVPPPPAPEEFKLTPEEEAKVKEAEKKPGCCLWPF